MLGGRFGYGFQPADVQKQRWQILPTRGAPDLFPEQRRAKLSTFAVHPSRDNRGQNANDPLHSEIARRLARGAQRSTALAARAHGQRRVPALILNMPTPRRSFPVQLALLDGSGAA